MGKYAAYGICTVVYFQKGVSYMVGDTWCIWEFLLSRAVICSATLQFCAAVTNHAAVVVLSWDNSLAYGGEHLGLTT